MRQMTTEKSFGQLSTVLMCKKEKEKKNVKSIFYSYCLCASFKRDEIFIILKKFIFHPRVQRGTEAESRRESYD